jgi:beta-lactamase regulating signal transducer with metallopeptidase domain
MALSYSLRLVCLIVVSAGLLQLAFELLFWIGSPLLLWLLASLPIRQRERALYLARLAPFILAVLVTVGFCVPWYVSNETNFATERVGSLCLLLAAAVSTWYGISAFAGLRIALRTMLFTRACRRDGRDVVADPNQTPILAFSGPAHRVALVGLVRPFIFISSSLLEDGGLDPFSLEIVLDHERSHAAQFDNWKLLSLHFLPRLNLTLPGGSTWMKLWQNAAEWAADEDAVRGSSARAFQLAETLVFFSLHAATRIPKVASTALVCREADLVTRVERLIDREAGSSAPRRRYTALALWSMVVAAVLFLATLTPWLRELPEHLLHLG